jgi:hypothetical protein
VITAVLRWFGDGDHAGWAAAVVALVGAGISTWQAREGRASRKATEVQADEARRSRIVAEEQARIAQETLQLQRTEQSKQLTPRLRISCRPLNPGGDVQHLEVALLGPPDLDELTGLTVTIRDDRPGRAESVRPGGGPTAEQVAAQIWGPYRFTPGTGPGADPTTGVAGADVTGRVIVTDGMEMGEQLPFALQPTLRPSWAEGMTSAQWAAQFGTVVRLRLECRRGEQVWILRAEIDVAAGVPVEVPALGGRP